MLKLTYSLRALLMHGRFILLMHNVTQLCTLNRYCKMSGCHIVSNFYMRVVISPATGILNRTNKTYEMQSAIYWQGDIISVCCHCQICHVVSQCPHKVMFTSSIPDMPWSVFSLLEEEWISCHCRQCPLYLGCAHVFDGRKKDCTFLSEKTLAFRVE